MLCYLQQSVVFFTVNTTSLLVLIYYIIMTTCFNQYGHIQANQIVEV